MPDVPFLYNLTPETIDALDEVDRDRLSRSSVAVPDGPWARLDQGAWLAEPDLSDQRFAHPGPLQKLVLKAAF